MLECPNCGYQMDDEGDGDFCPRCWGKDPHKWDLDVEEEE